VAVSFIGGGNQSTQRKPPTCPIVLKIFSPHGTINIINININDY
jgi:hypothetical protein